MGGLFECPKSLSMVLESNFPRSHPELHRQGACSDANWNSSYQTLDVTLVVMTSNSAQTGIMQNLTVSVVNNTSNCSPSSVQHDLHLGATKPGRKSTISSINSKLNSPVYNLSLNPYPMQFQSYTKIRVPTHSPSITSVITIFNQY